MIMVDGAARRDDGVVRELRDAGLRVTMARQAVLTWLTAHPHSTANAVAEGVRGEFGALSRQAVYDVLAVCTHAGLLRRTGRPSRSLRAASQGQPLSPGVPGLRPHRGHRLCRGGAAVPRHSRAAWFRGR